jgi:hypothetical protein
MSWLISILDILSFEQILYDSPPPNMGGVWAGFYRQSSWWLTGSTVARRPAAWICKRHPRASSRCPVEIHSSMQAGDWDAWVGCKLRHGFYR